MNKCWILFFLQLIIFEIYAQKVIEYNCRSIDGVLPVYLDITLSNEPMFYLGQDFYIVKYELKMNTELYHSFYTYKFNNRLYLLDQEATSLNFTKDQVLFDINQEEKTVDKVSGIFNDINLKLDDKLTVNNKEFYYYSSNSISFAYFTISQIVFDKDLDINQIEIKSYLGTTQCVLKNIVISLPEKDVKISNKTKSKSSKGLSPNNFKDIKFDRNWERK